MPWPLALAISTHWLKTMILGFFLWNRHSSGTFSPEEDSLLGCQSCKLHHQSCCAVSLVLQLEHLSHQVFIFDPIFSLKSLGIPSCVCSLSCRPATIRYRFFWVLFQLVLFSPVLTAWSLVALILVSRALT